jgi:hypothetical protein
LECDVVGWTERYRSLCLVVLRTDAYNATCMGLGSAGRCGEWRLVPGLTVEFAAEFLPASSGGLGQWVEAVDVPQLELLDRGQRLSPAGTDPATLTGWAGPVEDSGFGLFQAPAGVGFGPVDTTTEGAQVGWPGLAGNTGAELSCVVEVADPGWPG